MQKSFIGDNGLTLVEIIISMALLGLITIALIPLFTTSAMIINRTEYTLEDTYTGKDIMELMYFLSSNTYLEDLESELLSRGLSKDADGLLTYETADNKYVELEYSDQGDLVRVVTKVYRKVNRTELETKYEAYYRWPLRGGANEE